MLRGVGAGPGASVASTRWCRPRRCWRRPRPARSRASSDCSCRTAWRPATGCPRRKVRSRPSCRSTGSRSSRSATRPSILSGLHSRSAEPPPGVTGADHWVAAAFLCADKPKKTAGADVYAGTTIDQIIAQTIGRENLLPSLQLAVEDPGANSSNCGEGYSCTYTNTISWASPTTPLPMELNPQVVFERMFGDGSTPEQRAARRKRDRSILDSVTGSLSRLKTDVSASDRARLDDYTQNVREIERRLQIAMQASSVAPPDMGVPVGDAAVVRRAHQAAVRPAGAGLPGRHHARGHAALRARPHGPHLSGERGADRRLPRRVAPRRGPAADRAALEDQPVPREDGGAPREPPVEDRTATARCSTTRWSSTAATWATRISTCTTTCRTCSSAA